MMDELG